MSKKHKSRLEILRDTAPEMLEVLRMARDILHNALTDDCFDREIFERLQIQVLEVLNLAVGETNYIPVIKERGRKA